MLTLTAKFQEIHPPSMDRPFVKPSTQGVLVCKDCPLVACIAAAR